jgi:hypothetical protein
MELPDRRELDLHLAARGGSPRTAGAGATVAAPQPQSATLTRPAPREQTGLAPEPQGGAVEIDERSETRRDSKRGSQRTARAAGHRRGSGDQAALQGYRRNMTVMGVILSLTALSSAVSVAYLFAVAVPAAEKDVRQAQAAAAQDAPPAAPGLSAADTRRFLTLGAAVVSAPLVLFGALDLMLGIFAFLKKNWVNWVVAILYGLALPLAILGVVLLLLQGATATVLIGPAVVIALFVLAIVNIRGYGRLRASGLDAGGRALAGPQVGGQEVDRPPPRGRPRRPLRRPAAAGARGARQAGTGGRGRTADRRSRSRPRRRR